MKHWFKDSFHDAYMKNFQSRFPYGKVKPLINEFKKRQKEWILRKNQFSGKNQFSNGIYGRMFGTKFV